MHSRLPVFSSAHLRVAALFAILSLFFAGMPAASAATVAGEVLVSKSRDLSGAVELHGASLSDDVYVAARRTTGIKVVRWFLDDPNRAGTPIFVDKSSPFELLDGKPLDTRSLTNGEHVITAVIQDNKNQWKVHHNAVTVDNAPAVSVEVVVGKSQDLAGAVALNGASLGGEVYVAARTTGINVVRWFVDDPNRAGTPIFVDKASPFELVDGMAFDTNSLSNGEHVATAVVQDTKGQWTVHNSTFTVDNPPPAPAISTEVVVGKSQDLAGADALNGASLNGEVYVAARTTGVDVVRWFVDDPDRAGTPIFVDKASPFELVDGKAFDTHSLTNGEHVVTAVARDVNGQYTVQSSTFTVANIVTEPVVEVVPEPVVEVAPEPTVEPAPATAPSSSPTVGGQVRVNATFDGAPTGSLTASTLRSQFETHGAHVPYAEGKNLKALSVVANPQGSGKVLLATIPAGTVGGVMNFPVNIMQDGPGYDEAYLSYRLRFGDGFDFSPWGGKLPGLAGGPAKDNSLSKVFPAGCKEVTGDNGFSARGMWNSNLPGTKGTPILDQYLYHKNKTHNCGEPLPYAGANGPDKLQANRWYDITHRVVMNDPGKRNGVVEAWVDGEKVLSVSNMEFRNTKDWGINVLYMAGFFGGNDSNWGHNRVERMYYDDFVVHAVR